MINNLVWIYCQDDGTLDPALMCLWMGCGVPSVRFLYGWHGGDGLEGCVAGIWCAVVLARRGWERSPGRKEMFVKQKNIRKLCRDFMCLPIWPGWNWREGFV